MDPARVLLEVARRFHDLERDWADTNSRSRLLLELRSFMSSFPDHEDVRLQRLSEAATLVSTDIPLPRLAQVIVPFEHLAESCRITDADFLPTHADRSEPKTASMPVRVVLDDIRSAFNAGSAIRSAECMAVDTIHLCGYTANPANPRAARAALGAEHHVSWETGDTMDTLSSLKDAGHSIVAIETQPTAITLDEWRVDFPTVVVFGNERFGLATDVLELADSVVAIPMYGAKNSMNISAALAIVVHECRRQWTLREHDTAE